VKRIVITINRNRENVNSLFHRDFVGRDVETSAQQELAGITRRASFEDGQHCPQVDQHL
jgi:hypothetical protein